MSFCNWPCVLAKDLIEGMGYDVVYAHPNCDVHGYLDEYDEDEDGGVSFFVDEWPGEGSRRDIPPDDAPAGDRAFDWIDDGVLWLVNATVFHPRGFALALMFHDDGTRSWELMGNGREPWIFSGFVDDKFEAVEKLFERLRHPLHKFLAGEDVDTNVEDQ